MRSTKAERMARGGKARASKYSHEQIAAWGKHGGGMPWQYRYGTDEERKAFLDERRRQAEERDRSL